MPGIPFGAWGAMHKGLGADDVLEKPFTLKKVETIADRVIDRNR
jgi:DNA-binding response OmpR family regulator